MSGIGAGVPGSGAASGTERSVTVEPGMQRLDMGPGWEGLREVSFAAAAAGVPVGLALGEVVYEVVGAC